jgi:hypothetical protein
MRSRSSSLFLTGVVATLALTPTAAQAQSVRVDDAASDVVVVRSEAGGATASVDAAWARNDITRLSAVHGQRAVKVRIEVAELAPTPDVFGFFYTWIRTGSGWYRASWLSHQADKPPVLTDGSGVLVECAGVTSTVEAEQDAVSLRVPRACLDRPRWVRVGATTHSWDPEETDESVVVHEDTAPHTGADDAEWTSERPVGPRLRRG